MEPPQLTVLLEGEGRGAEGLADVFERAIAPVSGGASTAVPSDTDQRLEAAARHVFQVAAQRGLKADELEEMLRVGGLSGATAAAAALCWAERGPTLRGSLLSSVLGGDVRQLLDVDWTFGVTASSSEHASVGTTYVQLRLLVRRHGGQAEYVHCELNLTQFYDLLHELEKAKAQMDLL